jgi:hypothetical protein
MSQFNNRHYAIPALIEDLEMAMEDIVEQEIKNEIQLMIQSLNFVDARIFKLDLYLSNTITTQSFINQINAIYETSTDNPGSC